MNAAAQCAGLSVAWLSEVEVAARSGLPGPLVAELLPQLPTPPQIGYDRTAAVYTADAVLKAQIAVLILDFGIRYRYVRAAVLQPRSTAQLRESLEVWQQLLAGSRQSRRPGRVAAGRAGRWPAGVFAAAFAVVRQPFHSRAHALSRPDVTSVQHMLLTTPSDK
ncbi:MULTISPECIES: hypothetical protein [Mycobacterium]|uniref:TetR family transcriptional regulator n=1 Tax=Mycobacterium bouchedurhonense TaxID=701041 RepID=A0AAW5SE38_MYCBC|nr:MULTISPECIES: hypothetical protein [Mycobacterium]EUA17281.1 hypothetical protein I552_0482 [Mycobacterium xenopi 3993]MCV6992961.1 hypothetical protein [Mycobacterium bouchedurhonense]MCV6993170.1 hypothetical protein [Mycobacterium timonense]MDA3641961.1 hypothetical protein [Mycobacterium xenopi]MDA3659848.1 hypothetical protein [Mycobacterium xenopi]